jgi:shikimate kinase
MAESRRIYIIGFMGSGKSTTGKKLAVSLKWSFVDLDREIEIETGKTIKDLFSEWGEDHFRQTEAKTLRQLDIEEDTVIAVGGGAPCFSNNMDFMLETGLVIYLKMTPGQLKSRLKGSMDERPLLKNIRSKDLLFYITDKLSEREKYYCQASMVIDGINLDIRSLSKTIINQNI